MVNAVTIQDKSPKVSMKILTNGCSFTQGIYDNFYEQDAWPWVLGNMFDADIVNLAEGGGSNARIFRTTQEFLLDNSADLIVIGWTGPERTELPYYKNDWLRISHSYVLPENDSYSQDSFDQNTYWYKNCHNDLQSVEQTVYYIRVLQKLPIPCIMFNALQCDFLWQYENLDHPMTKKLTDTSINKKIKQINKTNWVNWGSSMQDYLQDYPKADSFGHPADAGHLAWAQVLEKKINETLCTTR